MRPLVNQTHKSRSFTTRLTIKTAVKLLAILLIAVAVPLALYVRAQSEGAAWFSFAESSVARTRLPKTQVTVRAAGRGQLHVRRGRLLQLSLLAEH